MAKKKKKKGTKQPAKETKKVLSKKKTTTVVQAHIANTGFWANRQLHMWIVLVFGFLLYVNTIANKYAVDDSIVIQRNTFTKKGMKGMAGIWGEDTFVGFFGGKRNLVSGGRYRPLTVATFALENQLFGTVVKNPQTGEAIKDADGDLIYQGNPSISHAINAILFGLLCMVLYLWMLAMFDPNDKRAFAPMFLAFVVTLLFAAHPLHTEAVANIKGRDEIMVTLGSVLATYWTMKSLKHPRAILYMIGAVIAYLVALFSKESAIPFLVIIPAAIYFFRREVVPVKILLYTLPFLMVAILFWFGVRNPIIYSNGKFKKPALELMNDPFMKLQTMDDGTTKYITFDDEACEGCTTYKYGMILWTWGEYLRLLAIPHPLTNDYYPKFIRGSEDDLPKVTDSKPFLALLIHLAMAGIAILGLIRRKPYAFALIFYAATFSVVSNLFFAIGTNMAERFMFMPSIGFSILCGLGLLELGKMITPKNNDQMSIKTMRIPLFIFGLVTTLYSVKTIIRNFDWYNDYTLFTQDIDVSPNSAKLNNAVSGVLQDKAKIESAIDKRTELLERSLEHSKTAISLHPTYTGAWILYGNANTMLAEIRKNANRLPESLKLYNEGIKAYTEVKRLQPGHVDVPINMTVAFREKGKLLGEKMGKIPEAIQALLEAERWSNGKDFEVLRLLGVANGVNQNPKIASEYFTKALKLSPKNVGILYNLETAYRQMAGLAAREGDETSMNTYLKQADEYKAEWKAIDPQYNPSQAQQPQQPQNK